MAQQKLSAKQKAARIEAAKRREEAERVRRVAAERTKKIFTIVVCIILVLALGIPTVAIMAMGGGM
ncbi:CASC3 protein CASC3 [Slackia equolifaciens]|uniref:CASC3 protein CASC3 n=1 Tax=Slackia equolifaciens TaxID=498718 RepID=A0A3N0B064_9ACTN|nr:CASC3 protein CASC3 [Slackia equolifaciens]RNL40214.1 CASC3 protein CASC3 [Slackia equolifaciens]